MCSWMCPLVQMSSPGLILKSEAQDLGFFSLFVKVFWLVLPCSAFAHAFLCMQCLCIFVSPMLFRLTCPSLPLSVPVRWMSRFSRLFLFLSIRVSLVSWAHYPRVSAGLSVLVLLYVVKIVFCFKLISASIPFIVLFVSIDNLLDFVLSSDVRSVIGV